MGGPTVVSFVVRNPLQASGKTMVRFAQDAAGDTLGCWPRMKTMSEIWEDCWYCHNGHGWDVIQRKSNAELKKTCAFCGGKGGQYISRAEAERKILERELNKH
jgi:hypothetical protein